MRFGISSNAQKYRSRSYNSQSTIRLYQGARNLGMWMEERKEAGGGETGTGETGDFRESELSRAERIKK